MCDLTIFQLLQAGLTRIPKGPKGAEFRNLSIQSLSFSLSLSVSLSFNPLITRDKNLSPRRAGSPELAFAHHIRLNKNAYASGR